MKKTSIKILITILLTVLLFVLFAINKCFALSDVTSENWVMWEPTLENDSTIVDKIGPILGFIKVLGIIISVGTLSIIGIKIMLGSVEEKANYKQVLKPWLIGATMVFAITLVPSIIYDFTIATTGSESGLAHGNTQGTYEDYLKGYDAGIDFAGKAKKEELTNKIKLIEEDYFDKKNKISNRYYKGFYDAITFCNSDIKTQIIRGNKLAKEAIEKGNITIDNAITKLFETENLGERERIFLEFLLLINNISEDIDEDIKYANGFDKGVEYAIKASKKEYNFYDEWNKKDEVIYMATGSTYANGFEDGMEELFYADPQQVKSYEIGWNEVLEKFEKAEITPSNYYNYYYCYLQKSQDNSEVSGEKLKNKAMFERLQIQVAVWIAENKVSRTKNVLYIEGYDEGIDRSEEILTDKYWGTNEKYKDYLFAEQLNVEYEKRTSVSYKSIKLLGKIDAIKEIVNQIPEQGSIPAYSYIAGQKEFRRLINDEEIKEENYKENTVENNYPDATENFKKGYVKRYFLQGYMWGK